MSLIDALLTEGYRDPREVWIALRTDGQKGSGTIDDPYDGSTHSSTAVGVSSFSSTGINSREAILTTATALGLVDGDVVSVTGVTGAGASYWNGSFPVYSVSGNTFRYWMKRNGGMLNPQDIPSPNAGDQILVSKMTHRFDDLMRQLAVLPNTFIRIHIGPGTFETRGFSGSGRPQTWLPKAGFHICGSGIDVTVLKLVFADVENFNYYAIGWAYGNLTHYAEVSDLTVDSNLPGQPLTLNRDYANIACSAVGLSGAFCRIRRVKAINWGTQHPSTEAFVLAATGAHPDFPNDEHINQIIEDCVCVQPNENNRYTATVVHTTGGENPFVNSFFYSRAAVLRRNFVDCSFSSGRSSHIFSAVPLAHDPSDAPDVWRISTSRPHERSTGNRISIFDVAAGHTTSDWNGYFEVESVDATTLKIKLSTSTPTQDPLLVLGTFFNDLSAGETTGCVVEDNVCIQGIGGPYQDSWNTKEIIVRRNYFRDVAAGPRIVNGNLGPRAPMPLKSLEYLGGANRVAKATTFVDHEYVNNERVKILLASPSAYNGAFNIHDVVRDFTNDIFSFQYNLQIDPGGSGSGGIVEREVASLDELTHLAGGVAQGKPNFDPSRLLVGDRIKVSNATPNDFNGFFEVNAIDPNVGTFQYQMKTTPSGNAVNATFQRVWGIDRLVIEDNIIELRRLFYQEWGTPTLVRLDSVRPMATYLAILPLDCSVFREWPTKL